MAKRKTSPKPTRSSKTATKATARSKTTAKAKASASKAKKSASSKATTKKPVAKKKVVKKVVKKAVKKVVKKETEATEELEVATISRRRNERRTTTKASATKKKPAAKQETKPVAKKEAAPALERREKVNRRRQIDPTTCERDYSDLEVEFMNALDEYKRTSGRMFPTCSEVLEVILGLGYSKLTPMELAARKALEPAEDLEASVEADANEALEESIAFQSADEESLELI